MYYLKPWPFGQLHCAKLSGSNTFLKLAAKRLHDGLKADRNDDTCHLVWQATGQEELFEWEAHAPFLDESWSDINSGFFYFLTELFWTEELFQHYLSHFLDTNTVGHQFLLAWRRGPKSGNDPYVSIAQADPSGSADTAFGPRLNLPYDAERLQQSHQIAQEITESWGLGPYRRDVESADGLGFEVEIPPALKGDVIANHRVLNGVRTSFPRIFRIGKCSRERSLQMFQSAISLMTAHWGAPNEISFAVSGDPNDRRVAEELCRCARTIRTMWSWSFLGTYREGFDPFQRPQHIREGEPRVYPVLLQISADEGRPVKKLYVRASVVHAFDESFIELQTSEGEEQLVRLGELAGCPAEIWRGPIEDRWGLYRGLGH